MTSMKTVEWIIETPGRGFVELTQRLNDCVRATGIEQGLCAVFLPHTGASLLLGENADPSVRRDLERFMQRLAPDGDPAYEHDTEGPDDMPAHIRSVLTQNSIVIPIAGAKPALGTWQGLYLWEHRQAPHQRRVLITLW